MCWQAKYTVKQLKGVFPADVRRHGGKVAKTLFHSLPVSLCECPSGKQESPFWKIQVLYNHTASFEHTYILREDFYITPSLTRLKAHQPVYIVHIVEYAIEGAGEACTSGQWNANKPFINNRCHDVSGKLNYLSGRVSWKWGWWGSGLILAHYNLQCEWEVSNGQTSLGNTIMTHGGKRKPQRRSEEYQVLLS